MKRHSIVKVHGLILCAPGAETQKDNQKRTFIKYVF